MSAVTSISIFIRGSDRPASIIVAAGRISPNTHDILTGSNLDGTGFPAGEDHTCNNWTSSETGSAQLGHHDRQGGGANPNSWNNAHPSKGCSQANLVATGGAGAFYCFAAK